MEYYIWFPITLRRNFSWITWRLYIYVSNEYNKVTSCYLPLEAFSIILFLMDSKGLQRWYKISHFILLNTNINISDGKNNCLMDWEIAMCSRDCKVVALVRKDSRGSTGERYLFTDASSSWTIPSWASMKPVIKVSGPNEMNRRMHDASRHNTHLIYPCSRFCLDRSVCHLSFSILLLLVLSLGSLTTTESYENWRMHDRVPPCVSYIRCVAA